MVLMAVVFLLGLLGARALTAGPRSSGIPCDGNAEQRLTMGTEVRFDDSPVELVGRVLEEQFTLEDGDEFVTSDIAEDRRLVEVVENGVTVAAFEISLDSEGKTDVITEWYCTDSQGNLLGARFASIREIAPDEESASTLDE